VYGSRRGGRAVDLGVGWVRWCGIVCLVCVCVCVCERERERKRERERARESERESERERETERAREREKERELCTTCDCMWAMGVLCGYVTVH